MSDVTTQLDRVRRLVERHQVVDLKTLKGVSRGRSERSLFRDLGRLEYLSSYTHARRHYTLPTIPRFDECGLWFCQDIGFSRWGSLKTTLIELVDAAPAGYLHRELAALLRISVHNTLLQLVRDKQIRRESLGPRKSLYVSATIKRAKKQLEQRRAQLAPKPLPAPPIHIGSLDTVIAILVETINAAKRLPSLVEVTRRLAARNVDAVVEQVEQVWLHYGIDAQKKIPTSMSKPSKK